MRPRGALEIEARVRELERRHRISQYNSAPPPSKRQAPVNVQVRSRIAGMLKSLAARLAAERVSVEDALARQSSQV